MMRATQSIGTLKNKDILFGDKFNIRYRYFPPDVDESMFVQQNAQLRQSLRQLQLIDIGEDCVTCYNLCKYDTDTPKDKSKRKRREKKKDKYHVPDEQSATISSFINMKKQRSKQVRGSAAQHLGSYSSGRSSGHSSASTIPYFREPLPEQDKTRCGTEVGTKSQLPSSGWGPKQKVDKQKKKHVKKLTSKKKSSKIKEKAEKESKEISSFDDKKATEKICWNGDSNITEENFSVDNGYHRDVSCENKINNTDDAYSKNPENINSKSLQRDNYFYADNISTYQDSNAKNAYDEDNRNTNITGISYEDSNENYLNYDTSNNQNQENYTNKSSYDKNAENSYDTNKYLYGDKLDEYIDRELWYKNIDTATQVDLISQKLENKGGDAVALDITQKCDLSYDVYYSQNDIHYYGAKNHVVAEVPRELFVNREESQTVQRRKYALSGVHLKYTQSPDMTESSCVLDDQRRTPEMMGSSNYNSSNALSGGLPSSSVQIYSVSNNSISKASNVLHSDANLGQSLDLMPNLPKHRWKFKGSWQSLEGSNAVSNSFSEPNISETKKAQKKERKQKAKNKEYNKSFNFVPTNNLKADSSVKMSPTSPRDSYEGSSNNENATANNYNQNSYPDMENTDTTVQQYYRAETKLQQNSSANDTHPAANSYSEQPSVKEKRQKKGKAKKRYANETRHPKNGQTQILNSNNDRVGSYTNTYNQSYDIDKAVRTDLIDNQNHTNYNTVTYPAPNYNDENSDHREYQQNDHREYQQNDHREYQQNDQGYLFNASQDLPENVNTGIVLANEKNEEQYPLSTLEPQSEQYPDYYATQHSNAVKTSKYDALHQRKRAANKHERGKSCQSKKAAKNNRLKPKPNNSSNSIDVLCEKHSRQQYPKLTGEQIPEAYCKQYVAEFTPPYQSYNQGEHRQIDSQKYEADLPKNSSTEISNEQYRRKEKGYFPQNVSVQHTKNYEEGYYDATPAQHQIQNLDESLNGTTSQISGINRNKVHVITNTAENGVSKVSSKDQTRFEQFDIPCNDYHAQFHKDPLKKNDTAQRLESTHDELLINYPIQYPEITLSNNSVCNIPQTYPTYSASYESPAKSNQDYQDNKETNQNYENPRKTNQSYQDPKKSTQSYQNPKTMNQGYHDRGKSTQSYQDPMKNIHTTLDPLKDNLDQFDVPCNDYHAQCLKDPLKKNEAAQRFERIQGQPLINYPIQYPETTLSNNSVYNIRQTSPTYSATHYARHTDDKRNKNYAKTDLNRGLMQKEIKDAKQGIREYEDPHLQNSSWQSLQWSTGKHAQHSPQHNAPTRDDKPFIYTDFSLNSKQQIQTKAKENCTLKHPKKCETDNRNKPSHYSAHILQNSATVHRTITNQGSKQSLPQDQGYNNREKQPVIHGNQHDIMPTQHDMPKNATHDAVNSKPNPQDTAAGDLVTNDLFELYRRDVSSSWITIHDFVSQMDDISDKDENNMSDMLQQGKVDYPMCPCYQKFLLERAGTTTQQKLRVNKKSVNESGESDIPELQIDDGEPVKVKKQIIKLCPIHKQQQAAHFKQKVNILGEPFVTKWRLNDVVDAGGIVQMGTESNFSTNSENKVRFEPNTEVLNYWESDSSHSNTKEEAECEPAVNQNDAKLLQPDPKVRPPTKGTSETYMPPNNVNDYQSNVGNHEFQNNNYTDQIPIVQTQCYQSLINISNYQADKDYAKNNPEIHEQIKNIQFYPELPRNRQESLNNSQNYQEPQSNKYSFEKFPFNKQDQQIVSGNNIIQKRKKDDQCLNNMHQGYQELNKGIKGSQVFEEPPRYNQIHQDPAKNNQGYQDPMKNFRTIVEPINNDLDHHKPPNGNHAYKEAPQNYQTYQQPLKINQNYHGHANSNQGYQDPTKMDQNYQNPRKINQSYQYPENSTHGYQDPKTISQDYQDGGTSQDPMKNIHTILEPINNDLDHHKPSNGNHPYKEDAQNYQTYQQPIEINQNYKDPTNLNHSYQDPAKSCQGYQDPTTTNQGYQDSRKITQDCQNPMKNIHIMREPLKADLDYQKPVNNVDYANEEPSQNNQTYQEPININQGYRGSSKSNQDCQYPVNMDQKYENPVRSIQDGEAPVKNNHRYQNPMKNEPDYKKPINSNLAYQEYTKSRQNCQDPTPMNHIKNEQGYKESVKKNQSYHEPMNGYQGYQELATNKQGHLEPMENDQECQNPVKSNPGYQDATENSIIRQNPTNSDIDCRELKSANHSYDGYEETVGKDQGHQELSNNRKNWQTVIKGVQRCQQPIQKDFGSQQEPKSNQYYHELSNGSQGYQKTIHEKQAYEESPMNMEGYPEPIKHSQSSNASLTTDKNNVISLSNNAYSKQTLDSSHNRDANLYTEDNRESKASRYNAPEAEQKTDSYPEAGINVSYTPETNPSNHLDSESKVRSAKSSLKNEYVPTLKKNVNPLSSRDISVRSEDKKDPLLCPEIALQNTFSDEFSSPDVSDSTTPASKNVISSSFLSTQSSREDANSKHQTLTQTKSSAKDTSYSQSLYNQTPEALLQKSSTPNRLSKIDDVDSSKVKENGLMSVSKNVHKLSANIEQKESYPDLIVGSTTKKGNNDAMLPSSSNVEAPQCSPNTASEGVVVKQDHQPPSNLSRDTLSVSRSVVSGMIATIENRIKSGQENSFEDAKKASSQYTPQNRSTLKDSASSQPLSNSEIATKDSASSRPLSNSEIATKDSASSPPLSISEIATKANPSSNRAHHSHLLDSTPHYGKESIKNKCKDEMEDSSQVQSTEPVYISKVALASTSHAGNQSENADNPEKIQNPPQKSLTSFQGNEDDCDDFGCITPIKVDDQFQCYFSPPEDQKHQVKHAKVGPREGTSLMIAESKQSCNDEKAPSAHDDFSTPDSSKLTVISPLESEHSSTNTKTGGKSGVAAADVSSRSNSRLSSSSGNCTKSISSSMSISLPGYSDCEDNENKGEKKVMFSGEQVIPESSKRVGGCSCENECLCVNKTPKAPSAPTPYPCLGETVSSQNLVVSPPIIQQGAVDIRVSPVKQLPANPDQTFRCVLPPQPVMHNNTNSWYQTSQLTSHIPNSINKGSKSNTSSSLRCDNCHTSQENSGSCKCKSLPSSQHTSTSSQKSTQTTRNSTDSATQSSEDAVQSNQAMCQSSQTIEQTCQCCAQSSQLARQYSQGTSKPFQSAHQYCKCSAEPYQGTNASFQGQVCQYTTQDSQSTGKSTNSPYQSTRSCQTSRSGEQSGSGISSSVCKCGAHSSQSSEELSQTPCYLCQCKVPTATQPPVLMPETAMPYSGSQFPNKRYDQHGDSRPNQDFTTTIASSKNNTSDVYCVKCGIYNCTTHCYVFKSSNNESKSSYQACQCGNSDEADDLTTTKTTTITSCYITETAFDSDTSITDISIASSGNSVEPNNSGKTWKFDVNKSRLFSISLRKPGSVTSSRSRRGLRPRSFFKR